MKDQNDRAVSLAQALEAPFTGLSDEQLDQVVGGTGEAQTDQLPETGGHSASVTSSGVTVCCW